MIIRMVEFTHQAVDVGRCIPTNVGLDLLILEPFSDLERLFQELKLSRSVVF